MKIKLYNFYVILKLIYQNMVTQTIEANYDNWKIKLLWKIKVKKAKLYIVVIDEEKQMENDLEPISGSKDFIWTKLHKRWLDLLSKV